MECIFACNMNKGLLSIGTNYDRETNLNICHQLLNDLFSDIIYSDTSITTPYGIDYENNFLNQLAVIYTDKNKEEISQLLKSLEKKMGRDSLDKQNGIVKIDIDLVIWNDEILKPADINRSYIADLLPSLEDSLFP